MATEVTDPAALAAYNGTAAPTAAPSAGPTEVTDPSALEAYHGAPSRPPRANRPGVNVPQYGREAPETTWSDVGGVTRRILPAANAALAGTVGRALDVVPYSVSRLMGATPETAVHPVENAMRRYTVPDVGPPQTDAQGMADAGGKMLGETAPFMVAGAGALPRIAAPAIDAAPTVANAFRSLFSGAGKSMVAKPLSTIGGETAAAIESGAVGEGMKQGAVNAGQSPEMQQLAESTGQVLGPTALTMAPVALAARIAKPIASRVGPMVNSAAANVADAIPEAVRPSWAQGLAQQGADRQQAIARSSVGGKLSEALATPESQAGLATAEKLKADIPGFNPGTARASGDPELKNVQQNRDSASTAADLRARQGTFDESKGAISQKLETLVPPAEQPRPTPASVGPQPRAPYAADAVVENAGKSVAAANNVIEGEKKVVQGQLKSQADALPTVDRIDAGNTLRASRDAAQTAMDAETTKLRGQIGNADTPMEMAPAKPYSSLDPTSKPTKMTLNEVLDRRAAINQEGRDLMSGKVTVEDRARLNQLANERDNLDSIVEKASANDGALRAYADHYKNENVPNFRQGASNDVAARDSTGYGGLKVDPESVGKKFFNPNEESAGAQFDRAMGHDPAARQQMVDNALDDIRHNLIDQATGQIKKGEVAKWLNKNSRVLDAMPQTGKEIRAAVDATNPDALYARLGEMKQRSNELANTKLSKVLESVAGPGQEPANAIHAALNDSILMRQVMTSAGNDPSAQAAVRRAVFEQVRKDAPDVLSDPDKFLAWMKGKRSLSVVFTPEHLSSLENIARAAKMQDSIPRPTGTVATPKSIIGKIGDSLGISAQSAASTMRGVAQGRTSLAMEGIAQGTKFLNRQSAKASNAAWDEALSNPEAAKMVANMVRGKPTTAQAAKLRTYLLAGGVTAAEPSDEAK